MVKNFQSQLIEEEEPVLTAGEETDRFEKAVTKFRKKIEIENPKNSKILIVRYENKNAAIDSGDRQLFCQYLYHLPFGDLVTNRIPTSFLKSR